MTLPSEASAYPPPLPPQIKNVPSLSSVWPLKRSQKSLGRKLVPIPLVVSGGGNYVYFASRMSLHFVFSVFRWIAKLAVNFSQKFYLVYLVFLCNILRMCQYFHPCYTCCSFITNLIPLRRLRRLELKANCVRELQNMNRSIWNEKTTKAVVK